MDKKTGKPAGLWQRRKAAAAPEPLALTEALAQKHIERCRDLTRAFASRVFPEFWEQFIQTLVTQADMASSSEEQVRLLGLLKTLVAQRQPAQDHFCQILGDNFSRIGEAAPAAADPPPSAATPQGSATLSLVDPRELEETIAIESIVNRADAAFAHHLWALTKRFALLGVGSEADDKSNPVSPQQFCEAMRRVIAWDELDMQLRIASYKLFDRAVMRRLEELYTDLQAYLVDKGLLPDLRYSGKSGGQAADDATDNASDREKVQGANHKIAEVDVTGQEAYQATLLEAIRLLQSHLGVGATTTDAASELPPAAYNGEQLVTVLQEMQTRALSAGQLEGVNLEPLQPAAVRREMVAQVAGEDEADRLKDADVLTIDLVGMLFEYMLSDDNLPDAVKTLLSYLHTPFLKIAFIDQSLLERGDHPARVLLNSLAEAGSRWVHNDGTSQHDIYNKIKSTVFTLLQEFTSDLGLLDELVKDFQQYTERAARRQTLVERRALEKVQGEEKLHEAKILVNTEVRTRIEGRDLPSAILVLLLQPWSDYLSFVLLRYGQESEGWEQALFVMDELLWSIEPKVERADKQRLEKHRDTLILAMEGAFEAICYDQAEGRKLLDSVLALQDLALQSQQVEPAPSAMRTELESMAAEKAGNIVDTADITPEEAKILDKLKLIEFGTWLEMQGGQRVKVSWYNSTTLNYMLVDQQGNKVSVTTGLQLARQMIAGEARIIAGSAKPFFERALENIYHKLNAMADNLKTDGPRER